MSLSLAEAAELVGMNKTTVLRAIKSGKVSASRNENQEWRIEPVEVLRVWPAAGPRGEADAAPQQAAAIEALRQTVEILRADLADARTERDRWAAQAEKLALPAPVRRSWWRLAG